MVTKGRGCPPPRFRHCIRYNLASAMMFLHALLVLSQPLVEQGNLDFLASMAKDTVEVSRVRLQTTAINISPSYPGRIILITPGKDTYRAFWIRDFSMAADSGFISQDELRYHLRLVSKCQVGPVDRLLKNGLRLPAWSIPDHINYDLTPVFYPGTYSSSDDQGNGTFGQLPPIDDHFEFVHMANALLKLSKSSAFLNDVIDDIKIIDRLCNAFESPTYEASTQLSETTEKERAVGFGFCDAEVHTGKLLFASLLRYRAAKELAAMFNALRIHDRALVYKQIAAKIKASLAPVFAGEPKLKGWLKASTGIGGQADVWGTVYALYLGVLDGEAKKAAEAAVLRGVKEGTIVYEGAVRHVPTDMDFKATTAWERSWAGLGTYQNGAYWHTPTGWLIKVLEKIDKAQAKAVFNEYVKHLREQDFRKGGDAPWECFGKDGKARQNPIYMASVALPYSVLKR